MQTEIENLLNAGRVQDRHHHVDEHELGLMRRRRGFAGVIIAHQRDHAAIRTRAGEIGVAENIAGTVDARPLAVPDAEHAVIGTLAAYLGLLAAPQRRRRQILVEARLKDDVIGFEKLARAPHLLVETAERRAAIPGDVTARVEPGAPVPLLLHQSQPDNRLRARNEDPVLGQIVFVVEGNRLQRHDVSSCRRLGAAPVIEGPDERTRGQSRSWSLPLSFAPV